MQKAMRAHVQLAKLYETSRSLISSHSRVIKAQDSVVILTLTFACNVKP